MLRDLRGWPTPAPILAAAAALGFGVVTYMIVRRLHPPPPGSRAPPQVTRRMAAAVLEQAKVSATPIPRPGAADRPVLLVEIVYHYTTILVLIADSPGQAWPPR